jgi:transposase
MSSLTKKTFSGRTYYYLRETARVEGKPKVVKTTYLGRAEDIEAALKGALRPTQVRSLAFGDVAAALSIVRRLGLREVIDRVAPKRDQGLSVGSYLELVVINRATSPTSKRALAGFYEETCLSRLLGHPARALAPQRLFDAMGALGEEQLVLVEEELVRRAREAYGLCAQTILFDTTNFATYLDSETPAALARRGHAKTKRHDLRLVGLALLLSRVEEVPLLSAVYPGNLPDQKTFPGVVARLYARYRALTDETGGAPTLIFDKGMNSQKNLCLLTETGFHFVGSLSPLRHRRYLALAAGQPETFAGLPGVRAWRTEAPLFGRRLTLVLCHSDEFRRKQERGLEQTLTRAEARLGALGRPRTRPETIARRLPEILAPRHVRDVLVVFSDLATKTLAYERNEEAIRTLAGTLFGKTLLMTDQHHWKTEEIIRAYRAQAEIERAFRQLKDPDLVALMPMWHWTDQKIRVHAFTCVLALLVVRLIALEARRAGLTEEAPGIMARLRGIRETVLLYAPAGRGRPRVVRTLTEQDPAQEKLMAILGLAELAP